MTQSSEYQRTIIAGMLSPEHGAFCVQEAVSKLFPAMFDPHEGSIFKACVAYFDSTSGVLTEDIFVDMLITAKADEAKQAEYLMLFKDILKIETDVSKFRYAIKRFVEIIETQSLAEVLSNTMKTLAGAYEIGGKTYRGLKDAKAILDKGLIEMREKIVTDTPEGEARLEVQEVWDVYQKTRDNPDEIKGVQYGLTVVDDVTYGANRGELHIVGGFAGSGKSIILMNAAWHAAVVQGKNVFVASAEMPKNQWRLRMLCRHTQYEKLAIGPGLRYTEIKRGQLSPESEEAFKFCLNDFATNSSYGKIYILQLPSGASLEYLRAKMNQIQSRWNIDLLVVDYLSLLTSPRKRVSQREELDDLLMDAKQLALTFNNGLGVPFLTAHQTNRSSWELAKKSGKYSLNAFAGTSEVEKSSDVLFWLLDDEDSTDTLHAGFVKVRDGELVETFSLHKMFSHMLVEDSAITFNPNLIEGVPEDYSSLTPDSLDDLI